MNYQERYQQWLEQADEETVAELRQIHDETEIEDRFYRDLEFGTGGLRGVMGAGTNRMNKYVVGKATQGLCEYIKEQGTAEQKRGVVIAYDSRNHSQEFAAHAAKVLYANGVNVYLFESLRPTPMLSFAVRYLKAFAGIVITASHNPAEYNGYKVYFEDGGQLPPSVSDVMIHYIDGVNPFEVSAQAPVSAPDGVSIHSIGKEVDDAYLDQVRRQAINPEIEKSDYKLVYTPLHGSGNIPVRRILEMTGFEHVVLVGEQVEPDGNFPTVKSPNPENAECFELAVKVAKENQCDLIIGTDPDSDRVGVVVRNQAGEYVTLSGNQVGALLTNYVLSQKRERGELPEKGAVVSTIVTTGLLRRICEEYGVDYFATLTGFKFIGEKIHEFEQDGSHEFILGLEESYGYLAGTYARDKDAVVASMLIAEMGVYYSKEGKTLYDALQDLFAEYGYYQEETVSITLKGIDGAERIQKIMEAFRSDLPQEFAGFRVATVNDYLTQISYHNGNQSAVPLSTKSNVLEFVFENGSSFVARPSGTEPKIKLYFLMRDQTQDGVRSMLDRVKKAVETRVNA